MFSAEQITTLLNLDRDGLTATPDSKYALYKFDRGDKIEIRVEERFTRNNINSIGYMETVMRCFIPKDVDAFDAIYRLLRNALLVERVQ